MKKAGSLGILRISIVIVVFAVLSGCGVPFALVEENYKVKPGTLAVVSGSNNEACNRLADVLTQELKQRSTFRVVSQDEIGRRAPGYPSALMKESAPSLDNKNPAWVSPGNKSRIDALQAQLKTDYLFVVWGENLGRMVTTTYNQYGGASTQVSYHIDVYGILVEYPKSKPIGYSQFHGSKGQSCCFLFRSEGQDIDIMLKNSAEKIADKFLDITKTEKPGK